MKLLTVGDSFTYGEELVDINNAWPYLLGKQINYEVTNLGSPGCSNNHMIRNVIENADKHDLIIIAWSHFARLEVSDENGTYDLWPGGSGVFFTGELKYRKELMNYVNRHHNDEYLYNQYTTNIVLVQKYLESKGYKLVVSNISPDDNSPFEDWWVHPDLVDLDTINKLSSIDEETKNAEVYMLGLS